MLLVKLTVATIFLFCHTSAAASTSRYCPCKKTTPKPEVKKISGYYWRDYTGKTPSDALIGGYDESGEATYVGKIYKKSYGLLPATLTSDCTSGIATAYGRVIYSDENMQILCSVEQSEMKWVPTTVDELDKLSDCTLVIGGREDDRILHIGRVKHRGETIIGKVFTSGRGVRGLWIPYGSSSLHFTAYEVLTHNCTACH